MALVQARYKPEKNFTKAKNGNIIFKNDLALKAEVKKRIQPQIDAAIQEYHAKLDAEIERVRTELIDKELQDKALEIRKQAAAEVVEAFKPVLHACFNEAFGNLKTLDKRQAEFMKALDTHIDCLNNGNTTFAMYEAFAADKDYILKNLEGETDEKNM